MRSPRRITRPRLNCRGAEGECRRPRGVDTMAVAPQHLGWPIATPVMHLSELGLALPLEQQSALPGLSTTERRLGAGFSSEVRCSVSWAQRLGQLTAPAI